MTTLSYPEWKKSVSEHGIHGLVFPDWIVSKFNRFSDSPIVVEDGVVKKAVCRAVSQKDAAELENVGKTGILYSVVSYRRVLPDTFEKSSGLTVRYIP